VLSPVGVAFLVVFGSYSVPNLLSGPRELWVARFRHVGGRFPGGGRVFRLIFGREKWRTMGGGVWAVVGVAEGTGRPFLSPTLGGGQR